MLVAWLCPPRRTGSNTPGHAPCVPPGRTASTTTGPAQPPCQALTPLPPRRPCLRSAAPPQIAPTTLGNAPCTTPCVRTLLASAAPGAASPQRRRPCIALAPPSPPSQLPPNSCLLPAASHPCNAVLVCFLEASGYPVCPATAPTAAASPHLSITPLTLLAPLSLPASSCLSPFPDLRPPCPPHGPSLTPWP